MSEKRAWSYLSLIILFGFLIRTIPFINTLVSGQIEFLQTDHYYYLRRIVHIFDSLPKVPVYDYFLTFPEKIDLPSPPFYPLFLTLISYLITMGKISNSNIELITSIITAFFGGMIALPIYLISRKIFETKLALIVALLSVMMVPHYWYSFSLAGDHHSLETFLGALSLYFFIEIYQKERVGAILINVIVFLSLFLVWQGSILYIVLFSIIVIVLRAVRFKIGEQHIKVFLWVLILYHVFLALLPPVEFSLKYGRYSYSFSIFLMFFFNFLLNLYFFDRKEKGKLFLSLLFSIFMLSLVIKIVISGSEFFSGKEKWFSMSLEMETFFNFLARTDYKIFKNVLENGLLILHILLAIIGLFFIFKDWLKEKNNIYLISLFQIIIFFAFIALVRARFNYIFMVFAVISTVYLIKNRKFLIGLYLMISTLHIFFIIYLIVGSYEIKNIKPLLWLKNNTPNPIIEVGAPPSYAVHCIWDDSYKLVYYAKRPTIVNGSLTLSNRRAFLDHFIIMATDNLEEFLNLIERHKIKYLYYESHTKYLGSMYFNLLQKEYVLPIRRIYNIIGYRDGFYQDSYLENFRIVYNEFNIKTKKQTKVFEYVKGAKINVKTKPYKEITISIKVTLDNGVFKYFQTKKADERGDITFIVPYSTNNDGVVKTDIYNIGDNNKVINISLTEEDVRDGNSRTVIF